MCVCRGVWRWVGMRFVEGRVGPAALLRGPCKAPNAPSKRVHAPGRPPHRQRRIFPGDARHGDEGGGQVRRAGPLFSVSRLARASRRGQPRRRVCLQVGPVPAQCAHTWTRAPGDCSPSSRGRVSADKPGAALRPSSLPAPAWGSRCSLTHLASKVSAPTCVQTLPPPFVQNRCPPSPRARAQQRRIPGAGGAAGAAPGRDVRRRGRAVEGAGMPLAPPPARAGRMRLAPACTHALALPSALGCPP